MKRMTNRRAALLAAGLLTAGSPALAGTVAAQSRDIRGTVIFQGDELVPKGRVRIYLEDTASANRKALSAVQAQLKSNGGTKAIGFSLPLPASAAASPTLLIVAQLERQDGWLLARGSTKVKPDRPVEITLNTVMY